MNEEAIAIALMKSEFGNHPCFIFFTHNFTVSLLFPTFSSHRSLIFVWLLSFLSISLSYYFSPVILPSILSSPLLLLSVCSPYLLISLSSPWFLYFFHAVCLCLSLPFTKSGLHPAFFYSLSLLCLPLALPLLHYCTTTTVQQRCP